VPLVNQLWGSKLALPVVSLDLNTLQSKVTVNLLAVKEVDVKTPKAIEDGVTEIKLIRYKPNPARCSPV
jgi:hypothetical protein